MKIQRIIASDMTLGLRRVREEAGPDAVILSQKRTDEGVEILCAIDYEDGDEAELAEYQHAEPEPRTAPAATTNKNDDLEELWRDLKDDVTQVSSTLNSDISERTRQVSATKSASRAPSQPASAPTAPANNEVMDEIKGIKELFEYQLSVIEWTKFARRHPHQIIMLQHLANMGIENDYARDLVDDIPPQLSQEKSNQKILSTMEENLIPPPADLIETGGVVAVVGPTGVGKTTSLAKIAARYALKHGCQNVALVSTDNYRIGAQEQLKNFGKILGVPVHHASTEEELRAVLAKLVDKQLVLIDTAGMSQRDVRLIEQLKTLSADGGVPIKCFVALAANVQARTLQDVVKQFSRVELAGCILTKVDEATQLGGVVTALTKHKLPLIYVGTGQRVPEDLQYADNRRLIKAADRLGRSNDDVIDRDLLAAQFGQMQRESTSLMQ